MTAAPAPAMASFRDPSGFIFQRNGRILRQVNQRYRASYDQLIQSGLATRLVGAGLLIPHAEVVTDLGPEEHAGIVYKIIEPERLAFVSYPYEWCFSQLKDAALATLRIQQISLEHGMCLKDASAYNIQFHNGRPVLIDTLSFEPYVEGRPWVAYRQFCQHFLSTLALMAHRDVRLNQLLRIHIDGVPLDLASSLLPFTTHLRPALLAHVHLHARSQRHYAGRAGTPALQRGRMSRQALLGLVESLRTAVSALDWKPSGTEWADYYGQTNYGPDALDAKQGLVARALEQAGPTSVWDLGANTGMFSRLAAARGIPTVAFDMDPAAVDANYRQCRADGETRILPLLLDLTNPSPAIGWANSERSSWLERGLPDCVLALALVHHLAISNNVPLDRLAAFLATVAPRLVIEFVPKEDSQVQRLLATREDIFDEYTRDGFERAFSRAFRTLCAQEIPHTVRWLYTMERV